MKYKQYYETLVVCRSVKEMDHDFILDRSINYPRQWEIISDNMERSKIKLSDHKRSLFYFGSL